MNTEVPPRINFGVTNKFKQVGQLTSMKSMNNEDCVCIKHHTQMTENIPFLKNTWNIPKSRLYIRSKHQLFP